MKICQYCSAEINEQAILCVNCGKMLTENSASPVQNSMKVCPNCGNECHKDAIICVNCGHGFESNEKNLSLSKKKITSIDNQKLFAILAAVFWFITRIIEIFLDIKNIQYYAILDYAIAISKFIILFGLCYYIKKKNNIASVGFFCLALSNIILDITYLVSDYTISILEVFWAVTFILMGCSLLPNKKFMDKKWFLPIVIFSVGLIIKIINSSVKGYYDNYYGNFEVKYFIEDLFDYLMKTVPIVFACILAKTKNERLEK